MKTIIYLTLAAATALLSSCRNGNGDYDASGIFETTEITVSARGTGELTSLDVEEGMTVKAGQPNPEETREQLREISDQLGRLSEIETVRESVEEVRSEIRAVLSAQEPAAEIAAAEEVAEPSSAPAGMAEESGSDADSEE